MDENKDGNLIKGLFWASLLSIPLWLSLIGWVQIIYGLAYELR